MTECSHPPVKILLPVARRPFAIASPKRKKISREPEWIQYCTAFVQAEIQHARENLELTDQLLSLKPKSPFPIISPQLGTDAFTRWDGSNKSAFYPLSTPSVILSEEEKKVRFSFGIDFQCVFFLGYTGGSSRTETLEKQEKSS
jgi:hypothetical protein